MSGKLLDTNAVIALQQGNSALLALMQNEAETLLPAPVVAELYYGAYNSTKVAENVRVIDELIKKSTVLNCDADTAKLVGNIRHQLKIKGRPIPDNDIWIAALALQYTLTLVTKDSHFSEVNHLQVISW